MIKEDKKLTLEVAAGIGIFTGAALLLALILYPRPSVFAGLLLGMVFSLAMFFFHGGSGQALFKDPE